MLESRSKTQDSSLVSNENFSKTAKYFGLAVGP